MRIEIDPFNERNRIITMYDGSSKEKADEVELFLIDMYCKGIGIALPIAPFIVKVVDINIKEQFYPKGNLTFYTVILKGELTNE